MHLFGIVGNPVNHSKSPLIHNSWFKNISYDGHYQYIPVGNQEDLSDVLKILPKIGYYGINITVPYKNLAFEILQSEGFTFSTEAQRLRSINTIDFTKKFATNTDPYGFSQTFKAKEEHILVIGGGGVASSVVFACEGANITIANRTISKAEIIAEEFLCDLFTDDLSKINLSNFDVIVNATSLGMKNEELQLNYKTLQKHTTCIDTIYNPKMTPFLTNAQKNGCKIQNGTMMLIHQGAKAFELWTGQKPDIQKARQIMKEFLI